MNSCELSTGQPVSKSSPSLFPSLTSGIGSGFGTLAEGMAGVAGTRGVGLAFEILEAADPIFVRLRKLAVRQEVELASLCLFASCLSLPQLSHRFSGPEKVVMASSTTFNEPVASTSRVRLDLLALTCRRAFTLNESPLSFHRPSFTFLTNLRQNR